MVPEQNAILPDTAEIERDLSYMTERWGELPEPAMFELRAFKEGVQPKTAKFSPDWIEDAVEWAEGLNSLGYNLYAVRNPIRADITGSAKDSDIIAAFFLWADCDDQAAVDNVRRFNGPQHSASVVTGNQPSTRVHLYWSLQESVTDMAAWRDMQIRISKHFGSDSTVINPSRIMRLGGTVAYPAKHKVERGYGKFLTTFRNAYDTPRQPVTLEQMGRVFAAAPQSATQSADNGFQMDLGPQPLDRERLAIQALSGQEWHHAVIRLVASYVGKGLSDAEIHSLTDPLTLAGYTVDQTRAEVQIAIDGARAKGWTPDTYAVPTFDAENSNVQKMHIAQDGNAEEICTAPDLEWFDDIEPVLSDSYIVKGVLAQEAMSVVYGPSNSGKTFFALDIAYHAAIGAQWRGKRVSQTAVLYLAAEGGRGVANRIAALKQETGVCEVPFALRRAGMDLLKSEADLQTIFDLATQVKAKSGDAPLMIVIDTLSRVMAGGDENSAADMTALIRNIDALRAATSAHIMLVHHTGKDTARGARGHSSLRAATDTEIEVQNAEDDEGAEHRAAMVTKQRDYAGSDSFAFTLKAVPLGTDQDGDTVTSCVVEPADGEEFKAVKKAKKGIGGNQKVLLDTFDQMRGEGIGRPNPGGVGMPEPGRFWTVSMAEFRDACMGKFAVENKRGAWRDAWKGVSEVRGIFCSASDLVWRTDRPVSGK